MSSLPKGLLPTTIEDPDTWHQINPDYIPTALQQRRRVYARLMQGPYSPSYFECIGDCIGEQQALKFAEQFRCYQLNFYQVEEDIL